MIRIRTARPLPDSSHRIVVPALALLGALGAAVALPAPAAATSYVMMSDAALVDQAPLIVEAEVVSWTAAPSAGRPATDYTIDVRRVLKGSPGANPLTVRVPGGVDADGVPYRVWGAPVFRPGERALLFLGPRGDGTLGISQLMLGAFHRGLLAGRALAVRDLSEARPVTLDGSLDGKTATTAEPARDFDAFADWVAERAAGTAPAARYLVDVSRDDLARLAARYTLLASGTTHFRWFNGGGTWYAYQTGQAGMPDGGFPEVQSAVAAWNADPGSSLSLSYGGTTTRSSGFTSRDGANVVLFDDPNQEITGSFNCSQGGVLAVGGVSGVSGTGTYNGQTYYQIAEGDVVTQDGAGCYFAGNGGKNGEQVFAHEIGHALGLGHSCGDSSSPSCSDPKLDDAIMRAFAHNDGRGARLGQDDRDAIAVLYGAGSTSCSSPPAAPSHLAASATSSSRIDLSWTDNSKDEDGFVVERKPASASTYSVIANLGAGASSYADQGLAAGSTYDYRVQAVGCGGGSSWAGPASATTSSAAPPPPPSPSPSPTPSPSPPPPPSPSPPPAPRGLTASAPSPHEVDLAWSTVATSATELHVEVRTGAVFNEVRVVGAGELGTRFTTLQAGRSFTFRVRAKGPGGFSPYSNEARVSTPAEGTLTAAQVACDAARLAGFLDRFRAEPAHGIPTGVNLSFTGTGDFAGLAYTAERPGSPEAQLAFSTNPEETTLLRNPARPQLFSVSLTRNHLSSDLVAAGDPRAFRLVLDPTLDPDPSNEVGVLAIDNLESSPDGATDAKPGRGLTPLVDPCHGDLDAADVHVLRVLSKVARVAVTGAASYETAIYRAPAPRTYRLEATAYRSDGRSMGTLAAELQVTFDGQGNLSAGTLRTLPACQGGQTSGCTSPGVSARLTLVKPAASGDMAGSGAVAVAFAQTPAGGSSTTAVDWPRVLAGSTWLRPLPGSSTGATSTAARAAGAGGEATLTAAEVACDADRLAGLLGRLQVVAPEAPGGAGVDLSLTRTGDFAGIAYASAAGAAPERQLAFSTNPEETTLLRNPARPQLLAVSLSRNHLDSDLVAPDDPARFKLLLNPTLALTGANPASLLAIDDLAAGDGTASDAKPGRGLAALLGVCERKLSSRDVHVFRVLSKIARARTTGAAVHEIAIYRGAQPGDYRVDVYPLTRDGRSLGRLSAAVAVGFDGAGKMTSGTLRVLGRCSGGQTRACTSTDRLSELVLAPPAGGAGAAAPAVSSAALDGAGPTQRAIDFTTLLEGTTWSAPL